MVNVEVSLVKPKLGKIREVLAYMAHDYDLMDLNHQMYVPGRFVFGNFKERKDGFVLSPGGIYYYEAGEKEFGQCAANLQAEKWEVVRRFMMPDINLEEITKQNRIYRNAKQNIVGIVTPLERYF